jgi:acyl carrier protein
MNFDQVLQTVNEIFIDVLEDKHIVLRPETTARDVDDWDSLTHIELVVAIEKKFGIRFTLAEVQGFKDVGAMCTSIVAKLA